MKIARTTEAQADSGYRMSGSDRLHAFVNEAEVTPWNKSIPAFWREDGAPVERTQQAAITTLVRQKMLSCRGSGANPGSYRFYAWGARIYPLWHVVLVGWYFIFVVSYVLARVPVFWSDVILTVLASLMLVTGLAKSCYMGLYQHLAAYTPRIGGNLQMALRLGMYSFVNWYCVGVLWITIGRLLADTYESSVGPLELLWMVVEAVYFQTQFLFVGLFTDTSYVLNFYAWNLLFFAVLCVWGQISLGGTAGSTSARMLGCTGQLDKYLATQHDADNINRGANPAIALKFAASVFLAAVVVEFLPKGYALDYLFSWMSFIR